MIRKNDEKKDGKITSLIAGSSNGRTAGSGPAYLGSNPSPAAKLRTIM